MIDLTLPLIGPILEIATLLRALLRKKRLNAALLHGSPGVGKTHLLDLLALEISGSPHAIEQVNGQSLSVELVRDWRARCAYGNLFSPWTIKRVDEFDCASPAARNEVLSLLDYLPAQHLVLARPMITRRGAAPTTGGWKAVSNATRWPGRMAARPRPTCANATACRPLWRRRLCAARCPTTRSASTA